MICPYCGKEHDDEAKFCPEIGRRLVRKQCANPSCSYRELLPADACFCPACGEALDGKGSRQRRRPMPEGYRVDTEATSVDLSVFDTSGMRSMASMFSGCKKLKSIDLSGFDTSNVTDMDWMFHSCSSLPELDLSTFNTSKVTGMYSMFGSCSSLKSLDLSNFDTSNVMNMAWMFNNCSSLQELDLSTFDTAKVTNMDGMFKSCSSLHVLDLSIFNTTKVKVINNMFSGCSSLQELDLSWFDMSNIYLNNWERAFANYLNMPSITMGRMNRGFGRSINQYSLFGMFYGCTTLRTIVMHGCSGDTVTKVRLALKLAGLTGVEIVL